MSTAPVSTGPVSTAPGRGAAPSVADTRWLVTGAGGMLGHDVVAALLAGERRVSSLGRA